MMPIIILAVIGILAMIAGITVYLRRDAAERDQQTRQILEVKEKDRQVSLLFGRIDEIDNKIKRKIELEAADKPAMQAMKMKLEAWQERLAKLRQRVEEVNRMPSQPSDAVTKIVQEISNDLQRIEDELKTLQSLMPLTDSYPVRV